MLARPILNRFLIQPARSCRWRLYERRFVRLLNSRKLEDFLAPRQFLKGASDQYLLWLCAYGSRLVDNPNGLIPTMPNDDVQRNWTGSTGETTLRQALRFFQIVRRMARRYSRDIAESVQVLDYGCGWGRIIRFFLRNVDHNNLYGCDCYPEAIEIAKRHNRWCTFEVVGPFPPTRFQPNKFDLIYLYSVFSHLSEDLHLALLQEFHRVLKPGGILIATTRTRGFILHCEKLRHQPKIPIQERGSSASFVDTASFLARYDEGRFCHSPTGGGGVLEPSFYGESCIPRKYVEHTWTQWFDLVEYRYADRKCDQNIICCRKREH